MAEPIDRKRVAELAISIGLVLKGDAIGREPSRETTLVHLNALAFMLTPIFAGTGLDPEATEFFRLALRNNLRRLCVDQDITAPLPDWLDA